MAYSIEFQMLSKDTASQITIQVSKIVLKINHTESKMSEGKIYTYGNWATGRNSSNEKKSEET